MNIVIPMAGRGTRMFPHTLTTPKPLLPIAGKPIVERLVADLVTLTDEPIEVISFIIGEQFDKSVHENLHQLAEKFGAKADIQIQYEPLGIAHALLCAKESFKGKVMVALSDTLFITDKKIDTNEDGVLFVQEVEQPESFGVVKLDTDGVITDMVEKPQEFVSNLALIGIYYFKDGEALRKQMQYLLENDIKTKGEYQLTDAISRLKDSGAKIKTLKVKQWLDCGNKNATVSTNTTILNETEIDNGRYENKNSVIIEPCYIGDDVVLENSVIGPNVSIGNGTVVKNSILKNSIVQNNSYLESKLLNNSMLGNHVSIVGTVDSISVGDYSFKEA